MPCLVTTDFSQNERRQMIFLDNGDSGDDDLSFSDKSYDAGEEISESEASVAGAG
jgi:hypothetical protein